METGHENRNGEGKTIMKPWFFALLGLGAVIGLIPFALDHDQTLLFFGFVFGFFSSIPVHLLIIAARKQKSVVADGDDWRRRLDEDFDDSEYVMAKPAKPQTPIVVMRRESSGCVWEIVEDNR
jgi:hypothetical protein